MLTVGLAGYDGGAMAGSDDVDHCLVVRSQSVHRIQEAQAALLADLASRVRAELEGEARP
jgi:D-sedoheptulose 7-phosphate isomerase